MKKPHGVGANDSDPKSCGSGNNACEALTLSATSWPRRAFVVRV